MYTLFLALNLEKDGECSSRAEHRIVDPGVEGSSLFTPPILPLFNLFCSQAAELSVAFSFALTLAYINFILYYSKSVVMLFLQNRHHLI